MHIISSDPFSGGSSFCIVCVCNHCHLKNQDRSSNISLASHLSDAYDNFSSYHVSCSFMTSMTMMGLGLVYLAPAIFLFLNNPLVMSPDKISFVVSVAQIPLVASVGDILLVV